MTDCGDDGDDTSAVTGDVVDAGVAFAGFAAAAVVFYIPKILYPPAFQVGPKTRSHLSFCPQFWWQPGICAQWYIHVYTRSTAPCVCSSLYDAKQTTY